MSKVIIITRKGEYNSQEDFQNVLVDSRDIEKLVIIKEWLSSWAKHRWESALKDTEIKGADGEPEQDQEKAIQRLGLDSSLYLKALRQKEDPNKIMIESLIDSEKSKMTNPYATLNIIDNQGAVLFEVILVLPENLQIGRSEAIPNFEKFIDCVKKDFSIDGNDNILYIHDRQLNGTKLKDTIIYGYDGKNPVDLTIITKKDGSTVDNPVYPGLSNLKNKFKFIAVFQHIPDETSYFQSQILAKKFGQPSLIDKLERIENDKNMELEDRIDAINEEIAEFKKEHNK